MRCGHVLCPQSFFLINFCSFVRIYLYKSCTKVFRNKTKIHIVKTAYNGKYLQFICIIILYIPSHLCQYAQNYLVKKVTQNKFVLFKKQNLDVIMYRQDSVYMGEVRPFYTYGIFHRAVQGWRGIR